jgi:hypothetical protein
MPSEHWSGAVEVSCELLCASCTDAVAGELAVAMATAAAMSREAGGGSDRAKAEWEDRESLADAGVCSLLICTA